MKFSHVCLLALVALIGLGFVAATEREVRSYTPDMEYVDHVELSASGDLPVADQHMLVETHSSEESATPVDNAMHFSMETEEEVSPFDSFLEAESDEVNTEVMRQMALEIHDAAQANIDEDGEVALVEIHSESEADVESEAESEMESESETEFESEMESEFEAAPVGGLTPLELAQEKADAAAEKKDAAAEKADKAEEKVEKKEAAIDAKILATPSAPKPAPATKPIPKAKKDVVTIPADLSAEHATTLRTNEAATATIGGALKEMGAILVSKDDTIRSLVYNISYLTVGIGKLANKVDTQKTYIELLRNKLALSRSKVAQLKSNVAHSKSTAKSIRSQLKAVEDRLNKQDAKATDLSKFLNKNQDKIRLPKLTDDLEIVGAPKKASKKSKRGPKKSRSSKLRQITNSRLRPVEGTQTFADASVAFVPAQPSFFPAPFAFQDVEIPIGVSPLTHPTFAPSFDGIPTIVVERSDDGQ